MFVRSALRIHIVKAGKKGVLRTSKGVIKEAKKLEFTNLPEWILLLPLPLQERRVLKVSPEHVRADYDTAEDNERFVSRPKTIATITSG